MTLFQPRPNPRRNPARTALVFLAALVAFGVVCVVGVYALTRIFGDVAGPSPEVCVASAGDKTYSLANEQMHYAALIAGVAVYKGLGTRGATIGLATAMQESSLHNLNYGDRDSLGLFQQRPSQGWGTEAQILDPYYAAATFYAAMIKIKDWKTGDVNDIAQAVQRSGVPDGYRKHAINATTLAEALTGNGNVTCLDRSKTNGDAAGLKQTFLKTFGAKTTTDPTNTQISLTAPSEQVAWMYAQHANAHTSTHGVAVVQVGQKKWQHSEQKQARWESASVASQPATSVVITLRG